VKDVYCKNYKSVTDQVVRHKAEAQILHEISVGNYVISPLKPTIVSSLGAVLKDTGKVRLLHDCSRPAGLGVNSYATTSHFKYETVDHAVNLLPKYGYMAKIDLRSAYRSIPTHPACYEYMGLAWNFEGDSSPTFLIDTRLPFGASRAPGTFQRISNCITRYLASQGYTAISYLDDFLLIEATKDRCQEGYNLLLQVLGQLGFQISWEKVFPPSQRVTFLGVNIDSVQETLSLPADKLEILQVELCNWQAKRKATKRELQQLIGKLNWAARVVKGGRTFLRRLIDLMCTLQRKHHHVRLGCSARADINWWASYISKFNGTAFFIRKDTAPSGKFTSDACNNGGGSAFRTDWFYCNWAIDYPAVASMHINLKELFVVLLAAYRWARAWSNLHIVVYSDNSATVHILNKGSSRNATAMKWIRQLFWLSAVFNFHLTAKHIPGVDNIISDTISRLDQYPVNVWGAFIRSLTAAP
jgi:hypothetical protein